MSKVDVDLPETCKQLGMLWCRRATEIAFDRLGFIPGYLILIVAGGGLVAYNGAQYLLVHTGKRTPSPAAALPCVLDMGPDLLM